MKLDKIVQENEIMGHDAKLTVAQVAEIADCHRNTVLQYERRGFLKSFRDCNDWRRFTSEDARKLKALLEIRRPA